MHWYRPAAPKPCKTLWLSWSALLPWALECDDAVICHSLVKIQIQAGVVLLQPELVLWEPPAEPRPRHQAKGLLLSAARASVLRGAQCPLLCFRKERFTLKVIKKFISTGTKWFYQGWTTRMFVFVISEGNCTYSPLAEGIKVLSTTLDRFLSPPHPPSPPNIFIYLFIYLWWERTAHILQDH